VLGEAGPGGVPDPLRPGGRAVDQVGVDGTREVPADDPSTNLVGDRADLAEPLGPEEVRDPTGVPQLGLDRPVGGERGDRLGELPDVDLEGVGVVSSEDEPLAGPIGVEELDPGEPEVAVGGAPR